MVSCRVFSGLGYKAVTPPPNECGIGVHLSCLFPLWTLIAFIIRAKVIRTLFLLLNHRTPICCTNKGRINTNKAQHGIPFQILQIHKAPQPSAHAERPASSPPLLPRGICRHPTPGKRQRQPAPQSIPPSPPNLYTTTPDPSWEPPAPQTL